jgi:hypothetical protein
MPNLSSMLERAERAVSSVPLPTGGLERLRILRDRKRRNQRIAAGSVGIAVFVTALWIVLTGGPFDRSVTPGGGGGVTGPTISEPAIPQGAVGAGLIGLPPEGAIPSTPTTGVLVLSFMSGRTMGDAERFNAFLYADGRLIWTQLTDPSPGLIEQRLTPEGVELLQSEVLSTRLFDHDRNLLAAPGLYFGQIQVRDGDRLVSVIWGDCCDPVTSSAAKETPTPEQARALQRLDVMIEDPASWLPAGAWEDPEMKPYVPTRYSVCVNADSGFGLDRVLGSLPQDAGDLLRSWDRTLEVIDHTMGPDLDVWCSDVTTEQARPLAAIFEDAHLGHRDLGSQPVYVSESLGTAEVSIGFFAQLPHEVA